MRYYDSRPQSPLTDQQIMRSAPSVFATEPWGQMSGRYRFVPTIDVINFMRRAGFLPVRAEQGRTRVQGKADFTRHLIRFRHSEFFDPSRPLEVGGTIPEIVLVNSHDGTTGYNLDSGLFRKVCSNGLMVQDAQFGSLKARHSGRESDFYEQISAATAQIVQSAPAALERVERWQGLSLPAPAQTALARAALAIRDGSDDAPKIATAEPLRARRYEDMPDRDGRRDLWTTVNVVQENILRGGMRGTGSTGRRYTSRPVASVTEDTRINRAIWQLGEEMARILATSAS